MPLSPLYHARQNLPGTVYKPFDICIDHGFPFVKISLMSRFQAQCQSGVIYQDIYSLKRFWQTPDCSRNIFTAADIKLQEVALRVGQFLL